MHTSTSDIFHIYEKIVYNFLMGLRAKSSNYRIHTVFETYSKVSKVTISNFLKSLTIFKFYRNLEKLNLLIMVNFDKKLMCIQRDRSKKLTNIDTFSKRSKMTTDFEILK